VPHRVLIAATIALAACSRASPDVAPTASASATATTAAEASASAAPAASASAAPIASAGATATARPEAPTDLVGKAFQGYTVDAAPGATVTGGATSASVKTPDYQLVVYFAKPQDTAAKLKPLFVKDRAWKRFIVEREDGFTAEFKTKVFGMRWVTVADKTLYVEISSTTERGGLEGFDAAGTIKRR
jgi:hypothetical protein